MAVIVFFAWLGVAALVSWLTAFQMPDGYGNAIFMCQLVGGLVSAGFMAMGLPTAIDPSTKVVVSGPGGGPNRYTTWPREKGIKLVEIGLAVFVTANAGGYLLDRAMGLPDRHAWKVTAGAKAYTRTERAQLDACLATVWTPQAETCNVRYRVTAREGDKARLDLRRATCPTPAIQACVSQHLAGGTVVVDKRVHDSIDYSSELMVDVEVVDLRGTGKPPPAEKAP